MTEQHARLNTGPVEAPRPSEVYADLIRTKILSGEIPVGTQLPPERMLVEESGLTRAMVRDALAQLQRQGLLVTKPGRGGGSIVSRPTASMFMSSVDLQLQGWAPGTQMLFESRRVMEPWCAYFAAGRRTDADVKALRAIDDRSEKAMSDLPTFIECKIRWHTTVAAASKNELLWTLAEAVARAILRQTDIAEHSDPEALTRSLRAHREITEAISDQDSDLAYRLMTEHSHTPPLIEDCDDATDFCAFPARPA